MQECFISHGLSPMPGVQDPVVNVRDEEVEPVRLALVLVQAQPPHRGVGARLYREEVLQHAHCQQAQQRQPQIAHPKQRCLLRGGRRGSRRVRSPRGVGGEASLDRGKFDSPDRSSLTDGVLYVWSKLSER